MSSDTIGKHIEEYKVIEYEGIVYYVLRILECIYSGKIKNGTTWRVLSYDDYGDNESHRVLYNGIETLMEDAILCVSTKKTSYRLPILIAREHQQYNIKENHLSMVIKKFCDGLRLRNS